MKPMGGTSYDLKWVTIPSTDPQYTQPRTLLITAQVGSPPEVHPIGHINQFTSLGPTGILDIDGTTGKVPLECYVDVGPVRIGRVDRRPLHVLELTKMLSFCNFVKEKFDHGEVPFVNSWAYWDYCRRYDEAMARRERQQLLAIAKHCTNPRR